MNTLNTEIEWLNKNALFSIVLLLNKHIDNKDRKKSVRGCNLSVEELRLVMVEVFFFISSSSRFKQHNKFQRNAKHVFRMRHSSREDKYSNFLRREVLALNKCVYSHSTLYLILFLTLGGLYVFVFQAAASVQSP